MLLLLVFTSIISGGILLYSEWYGPALLPTEEENRQDYKAFLESIHTLDSIRRYRPYRKEQPAVLVPFDPNTVDSVTFVRLGLKPYVARNVLRYRMKGGKFHTPEAFARIYGITGEQFRLLQPYIVIGEQFRLHRDTLRRAKTESKDTLRFLKYPVGTIVDLNTADTAELKKIPGIGSGIARMIVGYRSRLGGFCRINQLQEVSHVSDTLNRWFCIRDVSIRRINLNKSSLERMKSHPYLNFYQAKVVVEYRKRKGRLKSLKQLALYDEFTQKDLERLEPYVCFE